MRAHLRRPCTKYCCTDDFVFKKRNAVLEKWGGGQPRLLFQFSCKKIIEYEVKAVIK